MGTLGAQMPGRWVGLVPRSRGDRHAPCQGTGAMGMLDAQTAGWWARSVPRCQGDGHARHPVTRVKGPDAGVMGLPGAQKPGAMGMFGAQKPG